MSYTGNSYGYLFNYPKESRSKFSNQNLISSPLNNLNLNYSNNKPPSTKQEKTCRNNKIKFSFRK